MVRILNPQEIAPSNLQVIGQSAPFIRVVFTVGSCAPISGTEVKSYETEADMLHAWQEFFMEVDPDIVTGYNITQFDIPFMLKRASINGLDTFPFLGRIKCEYSIHISFESAN